MKRFFAFRNFIGVIAVALVFSFTMLSTNSSVHAASSNATVTHVEINGYGETIKVLDREVFNYPIGEKFHNYMSSFDGYVISGISSSTSSIGGIERVVAEVKWQKTEEKEEQVTEQIPYETIEKKDDTLDKGKKVVDQEGVIGEKKVIYNVTYIGGIEQSRDISSVEVVMEPVDEIIRIGTKVTEIKEEQKIEEIPYETKKVEDPDLEEGKEVVDQTGVTGELTTTYKVTYVNDTEVSREISSEKVTVEPIDEIIRVGTGVKEIKEEQKSEEIPYETKVVEDPDLEQGKEIVVQAGIVGEKTVTYKVTYLNGKEISREIVSEETTSESVGEIIRVGTKSPALKNGDRHKDVVKLKSDLAKVGFKIPGKGTTLFGTQTEKQVKAFQKYYGLGVNGTFDKHTETKLNKVVNSPLQNGKRHKDTVQLKKDLANAGFTVPGNGTTLFGKQTEVQLKAFQKQYGLVQNGIADEVTLKKLNTIANQALANGMKHQKVVKLKKDLAKAGFKVPGKGTTLFGKQTEKQVKAFQTYYGLNANGTFDKNTETKLNTVVNSPLQNGKRHKDTVQLKKDLADAGFTVPGKGTTLFGKQTAVQVKAFQKQYGLVQNGIADEVTLKKLNTIANQALANGMKHQKVVTLKKDLAKAGFKVPGKGTTLYGKQTEKQVKAFQIYYGLDANGTFDKDTETKLKEVVDSPLQNGKRHKDTIQLKRNLAKAGFTVPGNETTLFGKQTEKQVKAFQKQYGLVQNGIADQLTLIKLNEIVSSK